jgi:hypothetical protein
MSTTTLIVLTVVDVAALVLVLAAFLVVIARKLRSIATTLGEVLAAVGDAAEPVGELEPLAAGVNSVLRDITGALPAIAERAETVAARQP